MYKSPPIEGHGDQLVGDALVGLEHVPQLGLAGCGVFGPDLVTGLDLFDWDVAGGGRDECPGGEAVDFRFGDDAAAALEDVAEAFGLLEVFADGGDDSPEGLAHVVDLEHGEPE
jgi:hypothetical protein